MKGEKNSHMQKFARKYTRKFNASQQARLLLTGLFLLCFFLSPISAQAQTGIGPTATPVVDESPSIVPDQVDIKPTALDFAIRKRLVKILNATCWYIDPQVEVQEGVVFLSGLAKTEDHRKWAGDLARNTQDVVAVVNKMQLTEVSLWDFRPAYEELRNIWSGFIRSLPLIGFNLLILLISVFISRLTAHAARRTLKRKLSNPLLLNVGGYTVGLLTFLVGLFIVLQIAGLTNVAMTVIGGTGLFGLILGIAFRDITENFLASIFLSMQNPFRSGDLVGIGEVEGFVEALTTRVTILTTLEGNQVQIPNSTVYKSNIYNFTSNPKRRTDFLIGIGYDDSISKAQEVALKVLLDHPAVLDDPEPLVLVDALGSATVNLRIYFWIEGNEHSWIKVKSALIRLTKRAFQDAGISMPDEAREVIFPQGVPVQMNDSFTDIHENFLMKSTPKNEDESPSSSTQAEAHLSSEAKKIQEQSRESWTPGEGENLLQKNQSPNTNEE